MPGRVVVRRIHRELLRSGKQRHTPAMSRMCRSVEAATASITADQVRDQFACGPDVKRHLEVAQPYVDAGFDRLVTMNGGPDPDGFSDFFARELSGPLRKLTPSGS
jgi:hypothetical protein